MYMFPAHDQRSIIRINKYLYIYVYIDIYISIELLINT